MRYSLSDVNAIGDLQQMYRWDMAVSGLPGAGAEAKDLAIRCKSANIPVKTQEVLEEQLHGHTIKRPGKAVVAGELTLTFVEDVDSTISKAFRGWEKLLWSEDEGSYKGQQTTYTDVKCSIVLTLLGPDDSEKQVFTLSDCYLSSFDPGGEFGGEGAMNPVATISYQSFTWKKGGA